MYHSINDKRFFMPESTGLRIPKYKFEKQIKYLKKNYNIIPVDLIRTNKIKSIKYKCIVTFDDGFKDNYTNAFPVLKKYGVPAIIFIINKSLSAVNWCHHIFFILSKVSETELISYLKKEDYQFKDFYEFEKYLLSIGIKNRLNIVNKIAKKFNIYPEPKDIYLTMPEIYKMMKYNISFGSHSNYHSDLTYLSYADLELELKGISKCCSIPLKGFAYPFTSFNKKVKNTIKNKTDFAMSGGQKLSHLDDFYDIPRIFITNSSIYRFACHCEGIF